MCNAILLKDVCVGLFTMGIFSSPYDLYDFHNKACLRNSYGAEIASIFTGAKKGNEISNQEFVFIKKGGAINKYHILSQKRIEDTQQYLSESTNALDDTPTKNSGVHAWVSFLLTSFVRGFVRTYGYDVHDSFSLADIDFEPFGEFWVASEHGRLERTMIFSYMADEVISSEAIPKQEVVNFVSELRSLSLSL